MFYTAKIKQVDKSWEVSFPDKTNIHTFGDSLAHALKMAEEALEGTLEAELEIGSPLIKSKTKPNEAKGLYAIPINPCLEVSYKLFEARKGKTQGAIAQKAGITQQAYQKLESGAKSNPTLRTLQKVAKALGKRLEVQLV